MVSDSYLEIHLNKNSNGRHFYTHFIALYRGSNKITELPKVTQLVRIRARTKSKPLMNSQPMFFILHCIIVISHIIKKTLMCICLSRGDIYWSDKYKPHVPKDRKESLVYCGYFLTWAYPNQDFFSFLFLMRDVELYIWPCKVTKKLAHQHFHN